MRRKKGKTTIFDTNGKLIFNCALPRPVQSAPYFSIYLLAKGQGHYFFFRHQRPKKSAAVVCILVLFYHFGNRHTQKMLSFIDGSGSLINIEIMKLGHNTFLVTST